MKNLSYKDVFIEFNNNEASTYISEDDVINYFNENIYDKTTLKTYADVSIHLAKDILFFRTLVNLLILDGLTLNDLNSISKMDLDIARLYLKNLILKKGYGTSVFLKDGEYTKKLAKYEPYDFSYEKMMQLIEYVKSFEPNKIEKTFYHNKICDNVLNISIINKPNIKNLDEYVFNKSKYLYTKLKPKSIQYKSIDNLKSDFQKYVITNAIRSNSKFNWEDYKSVKTEYYKKINEIIYKEKKSLIGDTKTPIEEVMSPTKGVITKVYKNEMKNEFLDAGTKLAEITDENGNKIPVYNKTFGRIISCKAVEQSMVDEGDVLFSLTAADIIIDEKDLPAWYVDDTIDVYYARREQIKFTVDNKQYVEKGQKLIEDASGDIYSESSGYVEILVETDDDGNATVEIGQPILELKKFDRNAPWLYDPYNLSYLLGTYLYNDYMDRTQSKTKWELFKYDPKPKYDENGNINDSGMTVDFYKSLDDLIDILKTPLGKNIYSKIMDRFHIVKQEQDKFIKINIMEKDYINLFINIHDISQFEKERDFMSDLINYTPSYQKQEALNYLYQFITKIQYDENKSPTVPEYHLKDTSDIIKLIKKQSEKIASPYYKISLFDINILLIALKAIELFDGNIDIEIVKNVEYIKKIIKLEEREKEPEYLDALGRIIEYYDTMVEVTDRKVTTEIVSLQDLMDDLNEIFLIIDLLSEFIKDLIKYAKITLSGE